MLSSVYELADARESADWERSISPREWREDLRPYIRTKIEAPPGDRLISRKEAAFILGVSEPRVSVLVAQGRLFGWKTAPGKPGNPLWLSARQIDRYMHDSDRVQRRKAWEGKKTVDGAQVSRWLIDDMPEGSVWFRKFIPRHEQESQEPDSR